MKKIIIFVALIVAMLLISSCFPLGALLTRPTPGTEATVEPTVRPTAEPEIAPPPSKTEVNRNVFIPENCTPEQMMEILGEPNLITTETPGDGVLFHYCFYDNFRRVFGYIENNDEGKDPVTIVELTYSFDAFGGLTYRSSEEKMVETLGQPDELEGPEMTGLHVELYAYYLTYKSIDLDVTLTSWESDMDTREIFDFTLGQNSPLKNTVGIGIGSTADEVIATYNVGMYGGDIINAKYIVVGNEYSGIAFFLKNGIVNRIVVGTITTSEGSSLDD